VCVCVCVCKCIKIYIENDSCENNFFFMTLIIYKVLKAMFFVFIIICAKHEAIIGTRVIAIYSKRHSTCLPRHATMVTGDTKSKVTSLASSSTPWNANRLKRHYALSFNYIQRRDLFHDGTVTRYGKCHSVMNDIHTCDK